jgi:hypothetical protein
MSPADGKTFAAHVHSASLHEIADLRLGKKTDELYGYVEKLHNRSTATAAADRRREAHLPGCRRELTASAPHTRERAPPAELAVQPESPDSLLNDPRSQGKGLGLPAPQPCCGRATEARALVMNRAAPERLRTGCGALPCATTQRPHWLVAHSRIVQRGRESE